MIEKSKYSPNFQNQNDYYIFAYNNENDYFYNENDIIEFHLLNINKTLKVIFVLKQ
jgi:hypothetical protein